MKKPKVLVIVGPTASGKTSLSIELALRFGGEIISADSRQVYRKLDIGTEKITEAEMNGIPHHLIDVADIEETYTAHDFKRDATKAITDITTRGKLPIVAGGTFFYVDVLLGKSPTAHVTPNETLREHLSEFSADMLYQQLERLDPARALSIDKHNKRRLVRALEIIAAEGKVPPDTPTDCPYDVRLIGIERNRDELRARIRARAEAALSRGLVNETKHLLNSGISPDRLSEIGLEYRLVLQHLNGEISLEDLPQKMEEKVWQYAKRQLTWLQRDPDITWYTPEDTERVFSDIETFLAS